jgi:hypothetical protein
MREGAFVESLEIGNWRMEEREERRRRSCPPLGLINVRKKERKGIKDGKILRFTW